MTADRPDRAPERLRPAAAADRDAMQAFLAGHAETSMFLRSNLAAHGLDERCHPHGTTFWLLEAAGELTGVMGATNAGYLMVQAPGAGPAAWAEWNAALRGQLIRGITGEDRQVRRALAALGLRADRFAMNQAEPLYRLELDVLPSPCDVMRPAQPEERDMLVGWYTRYLLETGLTDDPDRAREEAGARARVACKPGASERLLIEDGRPVAAAALNARAGDMVQVGGVFVPEAERNRGLGRRVTAARLTQARDDGARVAILFANNPAAARAYEAIGFQRIGDYRVAVLSEPMFVGVAPGERP
ncbi:GNAT family N-acetyltransferase [Marinibacterium profundimaris]|uniref:N-acetyltransferase domain-containing protein n=1 Tax=Marinibacterium profundimaris TaxID=1679460 RepID=A0A225NHT4_9RHOB|nr:GNAT family N-acetyltransferase [Marinibacterium profundimaris]OWU73395.1 hypothetical protein ATO3_11955 [Marinibacterium profundimaris]